LIPYWLPVQERILITYTVLWLAESWDRTTITAAPVTQGFSGQRGFFTDQSGVIRADPLGSATATAHSSASKDLEPID